MLENLRPLLTRILEPLAKRLNINPNIVTVISPFLALASAYFFAQHQLIADAIIFIGIIYGGYCSWLVGVLAIHSAITVSYVRARAESQGVDCNIGIAERAVRMIILMAGAVIAAFANSNIIFTYFIYALVILSYFTVGQRIHHVWKALKDDTGGPVSPQQKRLNKQ